MSRATEKSLAAADSLPLAKATVTPLASAASQAPSEVETPAL